MLVCAVGMLDNVAVTSLEQYATGCSQYERVKVTVHLVVNVYKYIGRMLSGHVQHLWIYSSCTKA